MTSAIQNTSYNRVNTPMALDAHVWVVKDNKIIDLTTDAHVDMAFQLGYRLVYFPYPKEKSDEVVNSRINSLKERNSARGRTWDEWLDNMETLLSTNIKSNDCIQSSIVYQARNGGEIMAGCFGTYLPSSDKVFWLFGHPDDPEWMKPKNSTSKSKYTYLTQVTLDLIWDDRTPVI